MREGIKREIHIDEKDNNSPGEKELPEEEIDENAESGANDQSRRMEVTDEREMTPKLRGKLGQTQRTEDMDSL